MKKIVRIQWIAVYCFISASLTNINAVELNSAGRDSDYVETILKRSGKIAGTLGIKCEKDSQNVLYIIANRYFQLNDIYEKRDSIINDLKKSGITGDEKNSRVKTAGDEKDASLYKTHFAFLSALSIYLDNDQVDAVKDGMTYGVLMVTYNSTLEMIPSLRDEEKKQILIWLTEAREYAIDAESSNKKHEVFGKYKGRINNYLSSRGYDLVKERENWYKRIEEKKKK